MRRRGISLVEMLVSIVAVFAGWELWEVTQRVPENLRQTAMSRPLGILMLLARIGGLIDRAIAVAHKQLRHRIRINCIFGAAQ